jgi:hypothetical protein
MMASTSVEESRFLYNDKKFPIKRRYLKVVKYSSETEPYLRVLEFKIKGEIKHANYSNPQLLMEEIKKKSNHVFTMSHLRFRNLYGFIRNAESLES